jgi:hypothetical protein
MTMESNDILWTRFRKGICIVLVLYLLPPLIPHWFPAVGGTVWFFIYILSIGIWFIVLFLMGFWGGCEFIIAKIRHKAVSSGCKFKILLPIIAVVASFIVVMVGRITESALPTGSHLLAFDPVVWQSNEAAQSDSGNISKRQMMLKSAVKEILPGKSRAEIEALLGKSLDTAYFQETKRDLIYFMGPQRNSLFPIDSEWLLIWLDNQGNFKKYAVVSD